MSHGPSGSMRATVVPSVATVETDLSASDRSSSLVAGKPLDEERMAHVVWRPGYRPLFRPDWTRHILTALSSVPIKEGALDERRLTEDVCLMRPVLELPRRIRPTLRRGLQLLVDGSEAMQPFSRDVEGIVRELRIVVGKDHVLVAVFNLVPSSGSVLWLRSRRRETWRPPARGTSILVLSDLGMSQQYGDVSGASPSEWVEFARSCRAAGCRLVALVPRGAATWSPILRKAITMIPWDERTSVSTVARAARLSHGRP
jgi:hypothetical protein